MYILKFNHNSNISSERLNPKNPEIIFDDLFDLFKIYSAPIQQDIFNNLECPLSESKNVTNYYITCKECNGNGKLDLSDSTAFNDYDWVATCRSCLGAGKLKTNQERYELSNKKGQIETIIEYHDVSFIYNNIMSSLPVKPTGSNIGAIELFKWHGKPCKYLSYCIVVSSSARSYRYRIGDIISAVEGTYSTKPSIFGKITKYDFNAAEPMYFIENNGWVAENLIVEKN